MIHGYGQLYCLHKKQMFTQTLQKIGSMKDELGGKIMTELAALTPKTYSHLEDDDDENKKKKHKKNV